MTCQAPLMSTYLRQPVAFTRGQGAILFDEAGRRYLDALSGIAVNTLGHAHPDLVAALQDQVAKLIHSSNLFEVPLQDAVARQLVQRAGMTNAFFCNSGLEANEAALKLARLHGHARGIAEPRVVVFEHAFHGRSLATLSATANPKVQKGFEPLVPGFPRLPFNDLAALEALARQDSAAPTIAAVLLESIQGEGGITAATPEFLQGVRRLCDEHGWLMMLDEVQSGMGRSGNPLAMRAALTTLEVMERDELVARAEALGKRLRQGFEQALADTKGFTGMQGKGLMIGIGLDRPCGALVKRALDEGLVINVTAERVVRLLPPLILSDAEADELVQRLVPLIQRFLQEGQAAR